MLDDLDAILVAQALHFALGDAAGFCLRLQIADDVGGSARVIGNEFGYVRKINALVINSDRRDAQAFSHVIERADVKRTWHSAADIRPMAVGLGKAEQLAFVEHRSDDAGIVEMRAALIDVVDDKDVARMEIALELVNNGFRGVVQRPDMGGNIAASLHDRIAVDVAER